MVTQRVTLVLGAGGVTGGAFHAGVLAALADAGWDPASAELIVGTSAGALSGTMLRAGLPAPDLLARMTGAPLSPTGQELLGHLGAPVQPPRRNRLGRPVGADSAMISDLIDGIAGERWPGEPLWTVAVRVPTGRRAVFGRDGAPDATPGQAAAASAAVPGLFKPVEIDGSSYVDGGVRSVHSLDVVADRPSDVVLVSAPMAHDGSVRSLRPAAALATGVRTQLLFERHRAERGGRRVEIIAPDSDVREVMGTDAMDPGRRRAVAEHVHAWMTRRLERGDDLGLESLS